MTINIENVKKWVAALRSGEYKQTQGVLRDHEDRYCCLGVACDVALKNGVNVTEKWSEEAYNWSYDDNSGVLPDSVMEWLGVDYDSLTLGDGLSDPDSFGLRHDLTATYLNDELGWDFNQIADKVEEYFGLESTRPKELVNA